MAVNFSVLRLGWGLHGFFFLGWVGGQKEGRRSRRCDAAGCWSSSLAKKGVFFSGFVLWHPILFCFLVLVIFSGFSLEEGEEGSDG
jgi:hypothetical protein